MAIGRDILYALGATAASPVWGLSLLRTGKWRTDWPGRLGKTPALPPRATDDRKRLLLHAVSVGEVNATRRLIAHFEQHQPDVEIVIASTTNTGTARARQLYADRHAVVRYPLDFSLAVSRFLDSVKPDAVALVELEVWPNFVEACGKRGIPVGVINGRLSARSFGRYKQLRPLLHKTFAKLTACGVQSEPYAQRFRTMGARDVRVLDTMKWDTAMVADTVDGADALAEEMGIDRDRPVIVAGSTGPGEEALLVSEKPADAQLVLVPRKPERFDAVAEQFPGIVRRTAPGNDAGAGDRDETSGGGVFLVDTMGELRKAYALADVVVVGRSYNGLGGSDPIEPIALGKPTIIGPDHANFAEVVSAFEDAGGIVVTPNVGDAVRELLANGAMARALAEAGRGVILSRRGATERYAQMLMELLAVSQ